MTVRTTRLDGTDWGAEILLYDDLNDTIVRASNEPWYQVKYDSYIGTRIIRFSSTIWQTSTGLTTDGGATWTNTGITAYNLATTGSATKGMSIHINNFVGTYTTNSGATWTTSTTPPANMDAVYSIHSFDGTNGICTGDAGSYKSMWYTSDGGNNWTAATTGSITAVTGCVMASATICYCTSGLDIFKSTDGGINWTDTTHDAPIGWRYAYAIDTDTILSINFTGTLSKYVNSTGAVTTIVNFSTSDWVNSNIIKATNGKYYFAMNNTVSGEMNLVKYDDSNGSVYIKSICNGDTNSFSGTIPYAYIIEGATNVLILSLDSNLHVWINISEE